MANSIHFLKIIYKLNKFCPDVLVNHSGSGHACPLLITHSLTTFQKNLSAQLLRGDLNINDIFSLTFLP